MKKYAFILLVIVMMFTLSKISWANLEVAKFDGRMIPMGSNPLSGVPEYHWYYGCSPTSGGMLIGYWDSHPSGKWSNLVEGDISTYNDIAKNMIASPEHIRDYWGTPDFNPGGHTDNCIADFMHTSRSGEGLGDGATWSSMIPKGLKDFAEWDNPDTSTNEAYYADSWRDMVKYFNGPFSWSSFKSEIDAGRPMLLDVVEWHGGMNWYGHSVVGYGYQDDMFNIKIAYGPGSSDWKNVTVGGFAIWDTWDTTGSQSSWLDWDWNLISSYTDENGVEWWPFLDMTLTNGYSYNDESWDWQVVEGVYFHPGNPIPEPASLVLLGSLASGLFGIAGARRRFGRR